MSGRRPPPPDSPRPAMAPDLLRPVATSDPPISDVKRTQAFPTPSDVAPTRKPTGSALHRTSTRPPPPRMPDEATRSTQLEALARLACNLPIEQGVEAIASALCATLHDAVPDTAIGVVVAGEGRDGDPLIVTTAAPHSQRAITRPTPGVPSRLFPTLDDEWVVVLPVPFEGASVHVADFAAEQPSGNERTGREPLGAGDPRARLLSDAAERAAILLGAALSAVQKLRAGKGDGSEIRELQARIIRSEKLASVGQIAAKVVHELNNPLTAIVTYADFLTKKLERDGHDPADVERLRRIGESADRILRFSRDLTTYSRPNETAVPLAIHEVLDRAVVFCDHILTEFGIRVVSRVDPATPMVQGLRGQLTQVFVNLITNAAHAIQDAGRDEGEILIVADVGADGSARISVGDNGNGISPENVVRVFDPFYTTKPEGRGTGLGLSIVRSIIEGHSGRIWVRSVQGAGTEFIVELRARS